MNFRNVSARNLLYEEKKVKFIMNKEKREEKGQKKVKRKKERKVERIN
jgi:hypothetical protein